MTRALIVVDVQNDFCPGGALAVDAGARVAAAISAALHEPGRWDHVVATRDHHIDPGEHFSAEPDYVTTWPVHCVAGTPGADFHPDLETERIEAVFHKGQFDHGYSGFDGATEDDLELVHWLRAHEVTEVELVGIATDHCVRATALDAAGHGFDTTVLLDLTAPVAEETTSRALDEMRAAGVKLRGTPAS